MAKHSLDLKQEAVNAYLYGSEGYRSIAIRYGIGYSILKRWVAAYQAHGIEGLRHRYQLYPRNFKYQAVQLVLSGEMSITQTLAKYNIPSIATLLTWVRLYNEGGVDALENKPRGRPRMTKQEKPNPESESKAIEEMTREELLEELRDRQAEVACLKKLKALVQSKQLAIKPKR